MKVLNLSLDNSVLSKDSGLAKRITEYGNLVEKYIVIVPAKHNKKTELSNRAMAYGVKSGNKILGLLRIYGLAKKILREEKFDVISAQDQYFLGLAAWVLARKFKIGLEIQVHGFEKFGGAREIIARFVIPRANSLRCVSRRLKRKLVGEFGAAEGIITVAPIYADFGLKIKDLRVGRDDGRFIFLTVGRLAPVKNIGAQIRAFKNLEPKIKNLELWIVGDGPERGNLSSVIGDLELEDKIKLFGWRDDLEKFYGQADAFLLTSDSEGWGLAVIEAASRALPIIMTDVGCAGEVIRDGESGIVIPVGDQKKLEEAMIGLAEDGSLRKRLGENAREAVKKLPSKEEILRLYKQSWEKAVKNKEL